MSNDTIIDVNGCAVAIVLGIVGFFAAVHDAILGGDMV